MLRFICTVWFNGEMDNDEPRRNKFGWLGVRWWREGGGGDGLAAGGRMSFQAQTCLDCSSRNSRSASKKHQARTIHTQDRVPECQLHIVPRETI
ncbi:unnamed protein product [Closterium sp. NIES-65]|nr:unnamed protein product [Closterium sp. NIES-65]